MSYHRRSRKNAWRLIIPLGIGALLLLTLFRIPLPAAIQDAARSAGAPFAALTHAVAGTAGSLSSALIPRDELLREQQLLREQISDIVRIQSENNFLAEENERLLSLLGYAQDTARSAATVLSAPPQNPYDILTIATKRIPVEQGTLVFADVGPTVIGTVERLLGSTAEVMLFSHSNTRTRVAIGTERIPATAAGAGGGALTARIPKDAPVAPGDTVVLLGTPISYTVGTIERIVDHPHDAEATAHIRLPINLFTLSHVFLSSEKQHHVPEPTEEDRE